MKNKLKAIIYTLIMTIIVSSCATSNDVASNRKIQKRKYNKGFFVDKNKTSFGVDRQVEMVQVIKENLKTTNAEVEKSKTSIIDNELVSDEIVSINEVSITVNKEKEMGVVNAPAIREKSVLKHRVGMVDGFKLVKRMNHVIKNQIPVKGFGGDEMLILLVILCFLLPFVAVGIKTDWDLVKVLIAIILSLLFWLPGIIYALLVVFDKI
jgi:uncharacterized membrane protein YqaE (UPF0057 family)